MSGKAWSFTTHGGRGTRGWKTLYLGVDRSGVIVAHPLTEATVDVRPWASICLVRQPAAWPASRGMAPTTRTAKGSRREPRSTARDRAIADMETLGRRPWRKASGYHQQARVARDVGASRARLKIAFSTLNQAGQTIGWAVRFNPDRFPGSDHITVTLPLVLEGPFVMPFRAIVTSPAP